MKLALNLLALPITVTAWAILLIGAMFLALSDAIGGTERDGSYVRIVRPSGGFALAYWCRDAWRFASGAQVDFEPVTFQGARG